MIPPGDCRGPVAVARRRRCMVAGFVRLLVLFGAAGCAHQTAHEQFQLPDAIPYREFPEPPSRPTPPGRSVQEVPLTTILAQCDFAGSPPDSAYQVTVAISDSRVAGLLLDLPTSYRPGNRSSGVVSRNSVHGSYLVAHFSELSRSPTTGPQSAPSQMAFWVGSEPGFATVGADTATRQVAYSECHAGFTTHDPYVAAFTIRMPRQGLVHYVSAVWSLSPGRYLRALGSSDRVETAESLRLSVMRSRLSNRPE